MMAHWFLLDTLLLANQANRDVMHANALMLTRQCVESMSIVELGMCGHVGAEEILLKWQDRKFSAGELRKWLQANVWQNYGTGLWNESWSDFMREFAGAVQPYAHYGPELSQWQLRLHGFCESSEKDEYAGNLIVQISPRAYDAQKATRITLYHAVLHYVLGRIWLANNPRDTQFSSRLERLKVALGKSRYLDGHQTDWSNQFWASLWEKGGNFILE
jgi:hypothetical protein